MPCDHHSVSEIGLRLRVIGQMQPRLHTQVVAAVKHHRTFFKPEGDAFFGHETTPEIEHGFALLGVTRSMMVIWEPPSRKINYNKIIIKI